MPISSTSTPLRTQIAFILIILFSAKIKFTTGVAQSSSEGLVNESEGTSSTPAFSEGTTSSVNEILEEDGAGGEEENGKNEFIEMEIIGLEVLPRFGNAVALSWGKPIREYNLNWTYGVYYGRTVDEALQGPKLQTQELFAIVYNLTFCSQYVFAVGVVSGNARLVHPLRNIRMIGTFIDVRSAPENLAVEFLPGEEPCLLIKWSASCPNIITPIGYSITVLEKNPSRLMIMTEPPSKSVDFRQTLRVIYGKSYDIKVSTDVVGTNSTAIVSYKVPLFLQPYKVRLTSQPDGTFMMYWREPYVPYYIGEYYYEVYVYPRRELTSKYETFFVNRPVFIYKGTETEYTFLVGLRSKDGAFKSYLSDPISKHLDADSVILEI